MYTDYVSKQKKEKKRSQKEKDNQEKISIAVTTIQAFIDDKKCNSIEYFCKINNISKLSFKGDMQNEDSFVKSSDEMKKSWKYLTPVRNPIVRQQFEKHFSEDTHYLHDGSNGEWFIKDEKNRCFDRCRHECREWYQYVS